MGLRSSCASSWSFFFFPTCFSRMAPRLKDKVKPNRRARGSSDCGTPSITSILPLQYKEGLLWHQVSSGWLSRGLFSLVYCIKAIKVTITVLCLCLYWLILAYGIQNTWEKMCWAAHPPVSCLLPLCSTVASPGGWLCSERSSCVLQRRLSPWRHVSDAAEASRGGGGSFSLASQSCRLM